MSQRIALGVAVCSAIATFGVWTEASFAAETRLLVLNKSDDTLSIVDPTTRKTVGTVPTGHGPHEVIAMRDGKSAIVANYGDQKPGNSLSVVDLATAKELRRVDLGPLLRPHGLAETDGKVYFTAEMNRVIGRYDPETNAVDRIVGLGQDATHMLAISPDGRTIATANIMSGTVTLIDRQTGKISHIAVDPEPEGIDLSPDGKEIWVGHRVGGKVTVIDVATQAVKGTLSVGQVAIRVKLTPDGKRALVSDPTRRTLVVIDTATRKVEAEVEVGEAPVGILITPDGSTAYVALAGENAVAEVDLATRSVRAKIETGQGPDGLAWATLGT